MQCNQEPFSLDRDCLIIQQDRNDLNTAVKQAVQDGIIKFASGIAAPSPPAFPPKLDNVSYPPLQIAASNTIQYKPG